MSDTRQDRDRNQRLATSAPRRDGLFTFPNPVNELAARSVAGGVLLLATLTLVLSLSAGHS